jgi:CRISPR-associated endonuclease/helicase Cas3
VDGEKVTVSSDRTVCLDQPARFARLNDRYGRWGLALLETVVCCADMTVSEEGS